MTTTAFVLRREPADLQRLLDSLQSSPLVHVSDAAATICRARTALQGAKVDALVCDLRFDDGDALALVSELARGELNGQRTRVLVLTAASDDKLLFEALLAGADGYFVDRGDAMRGSTSRSPQSYAASRKSIRWSRGRCSTTSTSRSATAVCSAAMPSTTSSRRDRAAAARG